VCRDGDENNNKKEEEEALEAKGSSTDVDSPLNAEQRRGGAARPGDIYDGFTRSCHGERGAAAASGRRIGGTARRTRKWRAVAQDARRLTGSWEAAGPLRASACCLSTQLLIVCVCVGCPAACLYYNQRQGVGATGRVQDAALCSQFRLELRLPPS